MNSKFSTFLFIFVVFFAQVNASLNKYEPFSSEEKKDILLAFKNKAANLDIPNHVSSTILSGKLKGREMLFPHRMVLFIDPNRIVTAQELTDSEYQFFTYEFPPKKQFIEFSKSLKTRTRSYRTSDHLAYIFNFAKKVNLRRVWSYNEAVVTFPKRYFHCFYAKKGKTVAHAEGKWLASLDDNFLLLYQWSAKKIIPIALNESTVLVPRRRLPRTDDWFPISEDVAVELEKMGEVEEMRYLSERLSDILDHYCHIFLLTEKNQKVENYLGRIIDIPFTVKLTINELENTMSTHEIEFTRHFGHFFNSLIELNEKLPDWYTVNHTGIPSPAYFTLTVRRNGEDSFIKCPYYENMYSDPDRLKKSMNYECSRFYFHILRQLDILEEDYVNYLKKMNITLDSEPKNAKERLLLDWYSALTNYSHALESINYEIFIQRIRENASRDGVLHFKNICNFEYKAN